MKRSTDKMANMPVGKLMLEMGIPMIISMALQALYNIVDSIFVSNMPNNGEAALNALTLAFPVQMLIVAVGIGTGVGVNALLSKSLGSGDKVRAGFTAGNGITLAALLYILWLIFGIFGIPTYVRTQTVNTQIFDMAVDYLRICCCLSMGITFFSIFEKLLQATGLSLFSTIAQVSGAVTNIALDPILIYGLLGAPEMGVRGAAYATVIGQIVSLAVAAVLHFAVNKSVPVGVKYLKPSLRIIKQIYMIGLPAIIAQALMSFMTYGFNVILVRVDESMVTAYGLYYKIQQFILFAAFGLRDAIVPIVSFNHGMGDRDRIKDGIKYGIIYTFVIMLVGLLAMEIFAEPFSAVFGLSGTTQELCVSAMRIISLSFIFAGLNIALQGVFQALDGGMESLIISLLRQLVLVLPLAWGFSLLAIRSMDYAWTVWLTFLIAEGVSAVVACILMRRIHKKKIMVIGKRK